MSFPPFAPRIYDEPGVGMCYDDGRISGSVDTDVVDGKSALVIHEWSSHFPGHGHSVQALTWLRERFTWIAANGVGTIDDGVGDIATYYWVEMHRRGLVNELFDDDGNRVDVAALQVLTRKPAPWP